MGLFCGSPQLVAKTIAKMLATRWAHKLGIWGKQAQTHQHFARMLGERLGWFATIFPNNLLFNDLGRCFVQTGSFELLSGGIFHAPTRNTAAHKKVDKAECVLQHKRRIINFRKWSCDCKSLPQVCEPSSTRPTMYRRNRFKVY